MLPSWFEEHRSTPMGEKTTLRSETVVSTTYVVYLGNSSTVKS